MNTLKKRSVTIAGHTTSVSLEKEFWEELILMAKEAELSVNALVTKIDANRGAQTNLSSAIRLYILASLKNKSLLP